MFKRFQTKCIIFYIFCTVFATHITLPPIQHAQVEQFLERAGQKMDEMYTEFDKNIEQRGARQIKGSPAYYMATFHPMKPSAQNMTQTSLVIEEATRYMADAYTLSKEQITFALSEMDISYTQMGKFCPMTADPPCKPKKYRSVSGYCNNVQNPRWGNANTKYARLLPPAYEDGVSMPRGEDLKGVKQLPSAREVSLGAHTDKDVKHDHLAALTVIWGQFMAHDIAHTPLAASRNGLPLKCCGVNFSEFHPECYPIKMPESNTTRRERCQEFVRSGSAVRTGCSLGPREQLNQVTGFLDGSAIYGSNSQETSQLREWEGGRLKMQDVGGDFLMPGDEKMDCRNNESHYRCFMSGDIRANENIGLAALHTLWAREHNRVANQLGIINRHWNDETIFQEARRIVIGEIQHVTYNEFLPTVLSQVILEKYNLKLEKTSYFMEYNINTNPSAINSVAHAALWFTATLMPDVIVMPGVAKDEETMRLADTFYSLAELYENDGYDRVLVGLLQSSTQKDDSTITDFMMNDLFKDEEYNGAGLDLAAQIIQRGRDHGLPPYIHFRKFCGLKTVENWNDLDGITAPKTKSNLRKIYKNVSDIDIFTGALSEFSMLGSVVGPTFSCLLGHQFRALREGDRHWYENNFPPSSFSLKQLNEIRKVTMARLICDNSKILNIQPNAFLKSDEFLNTKMPCDSTLLPEVDLSKWNQIASVIILNSETLKTAVSQAEKDMKEIFNVESTRFSHPDPNSPIGTAFRFNRPKREAAVIANTSLLLQLTSVRLMENLIDGLQDQETKSKSRVLRSEQFERLMSTLPEIDLYNIIHLPDNMDCDEPSLPCDHTTPFRSITGRCNNLNNPHFGKSMRPFNRLLTPIYDDGIGSPRQTSITGDPLPSARLISSRLHTDTKAPHRRYSLMLMQVAQIVDHDLTHTPVNTKHIGLGILDCTPCSNTITGCIPIPIPPNDPFYPKIDPVTHQVKCIPVTRSLPSRLTLGRREQMNQVTAYLDGSFIYGSDICENRQLRSFHGGKMNVTSQEDGKPLLPETDSNPECKGRADFDICFRAGDLRASEQPGLASLHTIFLREHNRIADELSRINRHWIDEEIYQQTRKILTAMIQHIVFNEFLPRIFGWEHLERYGLNLEKNGYFKGYNPNCDATLVNEFSAAAYRFGHTLLRPVFRRMNNKNVLEPGVRLRDHFFNPALLYNRHMVDELLTGLASTPMETFDKHVTSEVSNHLFEEKNVPFSGMDLPAINIQRGRDHGIPGYNEYRHICNLTKVETFDHLGDLISPETINDLRNIYAHVDDIDLFPGGLVEESLKGGIIGPTFACIVGNQFRKLRECDRFWYENDNVFTRFAKDQLNEIRKTTLSRIICDNSDITTLQRDILELPDPFLNPRVSCSSFKPLNLLYWKDQRRCIVKGTIIEMGSYEKISPCVACICTKEGVICESMKIDSCFSLAKSHSWDTILKDSVCKVQCAYAFNFASTQKNTTLFGFT